MYLIVLWIATLGADRIDLLGGAAPFALLPFHLFTTLVVLTEWRRRLRAGVLPRLSRDQGAYVALVLGILACAAASVLRSGDILLSTNRVILFAGTAVGTSLAIWGMSDREDLVLVHQRAVETRAVSVA